VEFLRSQFDKLLLVGFATILLALLALMVSYKMDSGAIAWLEKSFDMVTGSLLTLITGQLLRNKSDKE
jgi:hypothetical protein